MAVSAPFSLVSCTCARAAHCVSVHIAGEHTVAQRLIRTYVTYDVLERASQFGYHIYETHEVWGWPEKAPIFRNMMGNLFRHKFLATKFSKMNMDTMSEAERDEFTRAFFKVFETQVGVSARAQHSFSLVTYYTNAGPLGLRST